MRKSDDFAQLILELSKKREENTLLTEGDITLEQKRVELKKQKEVLEGSKQDREERKKFANKLFWFLVSFIACVFILLFLCSNKYWKFVLSDTVLVALLTTTTANIIGIFIFVVKYLFYKRSID